MSEVFEEVRRICSQELGLDREVRGQDELLSDLQLDSVGLLTLVVGLENRFRIKLREEDASEVRTVHDLVGLVQQRREEATP